MKNEIKVISHNIPNEQQVEDMIKKIVKKIEEKYST